MSKDNKRKRNQEGLQDASNKQRLAPSYNDILDPLKRASKIQGIGNKNAYNEFEQYDTEDIGIPQRQLGQFITNQLANLEDNENALDIFNKLNIYTTPPPSGANNPNAYDPNERTIGLNTYKDEYEDINPLITLIHEGTHALDDLYIRNSQEAAIKALAKMEHNKGGKQKNLLTYPNDWYEQAQKILDIPRFTEEYPLERNSSDNTYRHPAGYGKPILAEEKEKLSSHVGQNISNFKDVKKYLGDKTEQFEHHLFEEPFTEFTAHAVENIHNPWEINNEKSKANYWKNNNTGRKFLKDVTKGVYRNFQKLDPQFSTSYPEANQAFLDRISQLRNYKKYPTSNDYLQERGHTLQPGYVPGTLNNNNNNNLQTSANSLANVSNTGAEGVNNNQRIRAVYNPDNYSFSYTDDPSKSIQWAFRKENSNNSNILSNQGINNNNSNIVPANPLSSIIQPNNPGNNQHQSNQNLSNQATTSNNNNAPVNSINNPYTPNISIYSPGDPNFKPNEYYSGKAKGGAIKIPKKYKQNQDFIQYAKEILDYLNSGMCRTNGMFGNTLDSLDKLF